MSSKSERRLKKYIEREVSPPRGPKIRTPVVLSDSKGERLKNCVKTDLEKGIIWWVKAGSKSQDSIEWLEKILDQEIQVLGPIHLYVWLATCNLTTADKSGYISLTSYTNSAVEFIVQKYERVIELMSAYHNCRVTFLIIPAYSIPLFNQHRRHKNAGIFNDQDADLHKQIKTLNSEIKNLNESVNTVSPDFNVDLVINPTRKTCRYTKTVTRHYYNFDLYPDGVHPNSLLAEAWLKKLARQVKLDCYIKH